jgi:hypothetical protein
MKSGKNTFTLYGSLAIGLIILAVIVSPDSFRQEQSEPIAPPTQAPLTADEIDASKEASAKRAAVKATTSMLSEPKGEPVSVIKTGIDFTDTYEGERISSPDGSFVVVVEVREGCPGVGSRNYEFKYSPDTGIVDETIIDVDSCTGENGRYPWASMPATIDANGVLTADAVETDGSIIVKNAIVITPVD